jgi:hypothetical protein
MPTVNFSELQTISQVNSADKLLIRLDNSLSGAAGFARIANLNFEKSLGVYSTVQTNSAINWNYQGTDVKALTSNWQNTFTNFSTQSANNLSVYSIVNTNSATNWDNDKTIAIFTPKDNQPPATDFATLDTRNSISVLDFDDGVAVVNESAIFVGVIPESAILTSGITVRNTWTATSATSGNCSWGVQWMRCNTDIDTDSFDVATEGIAATNVTSGIPNVTTITCASSAIAGLLAGETYRLKIYRDTSDVNDTMVGDAELLTVEVRTAN